LVFNLRAQNKLTFTIPKELEELEYEEKHEFKIFLEKSYAEFKTLPAELFIEEFKTEKVNTKKVTEENAPKTQLIKEEIKTENEDIKQEKIKVEEKATEKINMHDITSDNCKAEVKKENKNALVRKNNYVAWILGSGITGLIGFGLFYMLSKKKY